MSVYQNILSGLQEAVEYEQGNLQARKVKCTVAPAQKLDAQEIKAVRNAMQMTQTTFAEVMGVSKKTVEAWEAGTNIPMGSSCRLHCAAAKSPLPAIRYEIVSLS